MLSKTGLSIKNLATTLSRNFLQESGKGKINMYNFINFTT